MARVDLAQLTDAELLKLRLKDLDVSIESCWLADCVAELNGELADRGLGVRPHVWLSDEWFSPSNTPGIAAPFYLTHPRLARLERKMMRDVEGGTPKECMKLLRHEAGHVVQHAFALHRRRRWQTVFGRSSLPYPDHYRPNPTSRNYVQHLRRWYAQAHPDEDFAETFAVWLTPRSNWRKRYADWPALEKLLYVDELMAEIAYERPVLTRREHVDSLSKINKTLGEHYRQKLEHYAVDSPGAFDRDLKRIFSDDPRHAAAPAATAFVRRHRAELLAMALKAVGDERAPLGAVIDDIVDRCRAMRLRAPGAQGPMKRALVKLLSSKKLHALYSSRRRQSFAV